MGHRRGAAEQVEWSGELTIPFAVYLDVSDRCLGLGVVRQIADCFGRLGGARAQHDGILPCRLGALLRVETGDEVGRRMLTVLAMSPEGAKSRDQLRTVLPEGETCRESLATLLRREIVERVDEAYRVAVPLVAEYVRQRSLL